MESDNGVALKARDNNARIWWNAWVHFIARCTTSRIKSTVETHLQCVALWGQVS